MTKNIHVDILKRKQTHFVLWRPRITNPAPKLFIGKFSQPLSEFKEFSLVNEANFPELWEIAAANCNLEDGEVYYYWFKVVNTDAYSPTSNNEILYCTDPMAFTVDRNCHRSAPVPKDVPSGMKGITKPYPASVILYQGGELVACDPNKQTADWSNDPEKATLPVNNKIVIYELPTRWSHISSEALNGVDIGNGTFQDVLALIVPEKTSPNFPTIAALNNNRAHLLELGINALELLPPADSSQKDNWGYGTANYFAPYYYLGLAPGNSESTASYDLTHLIKTCHQNRIRFFKDAVMAFCTDMPYRHINYLDFLIKHTDSNDDPEQNGRDGFGGDLIKYGYLVQGYNPITGETSDIYPSREFLKAYIYHWMDYFRIDGLRLDSVNNINNYDFLQELKDLSRDFWRQQGGRDDNFLVVGEELSEPMALINQNRLDGMWHERFKHIVRQVILGKNWDGEPSFELSVRKMIDCRLLGFRDGTQAINYITSHDVGGMGNERLYNWLNFANIFDKEQRAKLAFVCLLTAVGIPMILAGEEFVDEMESQNFDTNIKEDDRNNIKQVDPVNFDRLNDAWRKEVFNYVARLVKFRTTSNALAVNDTNFIHVDFNEGKRVIVWQRGIGDEIVVVVANFSDWGTTDSTNPNAHYIVNNWPNLPKGKKWREITQERDVSVEWAGKEPLMPWEAKVYATV